ncbi:sphingomyelin phosphodiesterase [Armillaria solidipes]|uniref:Sphingomyelin phosphodiesterase n=1 Tax=Armillaria solidipes TaxID=1076256 RepID=A0A2H3B9I0_9AGAR|nr:sphingomyelin phosphodiesterase [Armillaria solidipes]
MLLPSFQILLFLFIPLVLGNLVDDLLDALEQAVTCGGCHALLEPLKLLADFGDGAFVDAVTDICTLLNIADDDVCEGLIEQQGPIVAHVLRSISATSQTSTKLCGLVGLCDPPDINAYGVSFASNTSKAKPVTSQGRETFRVAHISDVHIDRSYTVGADANCTKPICCRNYTDSAGDVIERPAGTYGEYGCDTPATLIHSLISQIAGSGSEFTIFTGDVVEAAVWLVTEEENINDINTFNDELSNGLGMPVYPVIGNHEAAPMNSFPRNTSVHIEEWDAQWVFDTTSAKWTSWINSTASDQVRHYSGSYSIVAPGKNLRIISINTVYWYRLNFWLYDTDKQQPDPNGILEFTARELQAAEDAGQRAWIIAHMPPGETDTLHDQSNYYDQIVQRYKDTIAAQFFGHTHDDQFEIAYSDYDNRVTDNAVSVAWIAPSVTPREANAAFKIYDIDPDTYEVMDAHVYITNLSDPTFEIQPTWNLYYSARETFGPLVPDLAETDPLGPSFWHQVTERFESNDTAFDLYYSFKTRGYSVEACDTDCKAETICGLRAMRSQDNCAKTEPGLSYKRDLPGQSTGTSEGCEGFSMGHVLSGMVGNFANGEVTDDQRSQLWLKLNATIPA